MKIGLQVPSFTWPGGAAGIRSELGEIARTAEEAGFDSLWVMDHFFQIRGVGPVEAEMLESYSTLGYLAGVTDRVRLGALVTGVIYRHPGLLIKTVTTLDVLSADRASITLDVLAGASGAPGGTGTRDQPFRSDSFCASSNAAWA